MTKLRTLIVFTLGLAALMAQVPDAAAHERDHGRGHRSGWERHDRDDGRRERSSYWQARLDPRERREAERKLSKAYERKCGTVAGRGYYNCRNFHQPYKIGRRLPSNTSFWMLPGNVAMHLPRARSGTEYIWVDRDILLISRHDRTVLDRVISLW